MIFGDARSVHDRPTARVRSDSDINLMQPTRAGRSGQVNSIIWPNATFDDITVFGPEVKALAGPWSR